MRALKRIFVHFSGAAATQTAASIARYWRQTYPEWRGRPGYHILVEADGTAHRLQPDEDYTNGVAGFNASALHVCFIGDGAWTAAQAATIKKRIEHWQKAYGRLAVRGHRDASPDRNGDGRVTPDEWLKICPGFDVRAWCTANGIPHY